MMGKGQSHEIVIEIGPDGKITTTVQGVAGPACGDLTKWLEQLGTVEIDSPTDDFRKQPKQGITVTH